MFVTISAVTTKIVTVEPIFLGEFDTVDEEAWTKMQSEEGATTTNKKNEEIPIVRKNRIPSSICCN